MSARERNKGAEGEMFEDWQYGEWDAESDCTHCGGAGECCDGSDPLGDCPDESHPCHACGGSGKREDQRIF